MTDHILIKLTIESYFVIAASTFVDRPFSDLF